MEILKSLMHLSCCLPYPCMTRRDFDNVYALTSVYIQVGLIGAQYLQDWKRLEI